MIQVNTRVPEGLEKKTEVLIKSEYGYRKKSDFTRCAVVNLISMFEEFDGVFFDAELFAARQKEVSEITIKAVSEGLFSGISLEDLFKDIRNTLEEKEIIDSNSIQ